MNCNAANPKETGPVDIWQETFPVRFAAIDKSDRLKLDAVFQFFQEAAISHAENLRVGREEMAGTGQVWILSRMSVHIDRRPEYRETITVRSWPRGGEKLFAIRDFDIRDKNDIPVVSARSCWIIVDMEKRRPLRPQSVMDSLPQNDGINALTTTPAALSERGSLQKTGEKKALYTDVDFNGHVNNVRYIQWIEDALDPLLLEKAAKVHLDINYMNEILSGEKIEIFTAPLTEDENGDSAFAFEGRKTESGDAAGSKTAFRAELRLWT